MQLSGGNCGCCSIGKGGMAKLPCSGIFMFVYDHYDDLYAR